MKPENRYKQVFHDGERVHQYMAHMNAKNVKRFVQAHEPQFRWRQHTTREAAYNLIQNAKTPVQEIIRNGLKRQLEEDSPDQEDTPPPKKMKQDNDPLKHYPRSGPSSTDDLETVMNGAFMKAPTAAVIDGLVQKFIHATGNEALKIKTCGSCAREQAAPLCKAVSLSKVPNKERLYPHEDHKAHRLVEGMLLEESAIDQDKQTVNICHDCRTHLDQNRRPPLSLANGMWIGSVPHELKLLTLPERILIAKYFPVAYIFKMIPKRGGGGMPKSQLHTGYKGNVSTYRLDPKQVANMVDGLLMPPPAKILAATIGVTFVTQHKVVDKDLQGMFRVKRERVRLALKWLKANNPLYADIEISEERLAELPEDDVPTEILDGTRVSADVEAAQREAEGYVPPDAMDEDGPTTVDSDLDKANEEATDAQDMILEDDEESLSKQPGGGPDVVHLQSLGVVDVEGVGVTRAELLAHALNNASGELNPLQRPGEDYAVRRGGSFVNEYPRVDASTGKRFLGSLDNPNHLLGCFPVLFPYGKGGFETERPVDVTYEAHIKWALTYFDRRFRTDIHFPFMVFGVLQKRQVCRSAALQVRNGAFNQHRQAIASLKPKDFAKAAEEEIQGLPYSNPAIRALRNDIRAVRTRVDGTDESRFGIRAQIWGTILRFNAPSLWITINPADTQDPIAQVLAGVDIDLDDFCKTAGPDHSQRAANMAKDPYASAKFFHFIIETILEVLFGLVSKNGRVERKEGIYGKVQAYIGTVEAQGRGTLHLHMLVWLEDAPSKSHLESLLQHETFRERIKDFLSRTIRADIDGKKLADVLAIPKVPAVSYSRPVNPVLEPDRAEVEEKLIARSVQYHQCGVATCLKTFNGRLRCKRRAPFGLSDQIWVNKEGEWGIRRLCPFLNSWNPPTLRCLRANQDVKLIVCCGETCSALLYCANYQTKKQNQTSNAAAVTAKRWAITDEYMDDLRVKKKGDTKAVNQGLLQHCAHRLLTEREFSSLEIISYLMGWGDRYVSHSYVTFHWGAVVHALKTSFPGLREKRGNLRPGPDPNGESYEEGDQESLLTFVEGAPTLKNQLRDYQYRGDALQSWSFYDFVINTYDKQGEQGEDYFSCKTGKVGRPASTRIAYKPGAKKPKSCRVVRTAGHEMLPKFAGPWIPSRRDAENRELYCASMLVLLKPWRSLADLKDDTETFSDSLELFQSSMTISEHQLVENFEYYHDCWDAAKKRRDDERSGKGSNQFDYVQHDTEFGLEDFLEDDDEETNNDDFWIPTDITEEMIEDARDGQTQMREVVFADGAMEEARKYGLFSANEGASPTALDDIARIADEDELAIFNALDEYLRKVTREQATEQGIVDLANIGNTSSTKTGGNEPRIKLINGVDRDEGTSGGSSSGCSQDGAFSDRPFRRWLNKEQSRAHDIIERKLLAHLEGRETDQLKMLVLGPGGTGKSMLIKAITETFEHYGSGSKLAKCASSGVAATDISGTTVHSWAAMGISRPKNDNWLEKAKKPTKDRRTRNMTDKQLLIIDEVSMVTKQLFANTSQVASFTRTKEGVKGGDLPFGGLHVLLTGDFHQFPPVAGDPLYSRKEGKNSSALLGGELFQQFDTVVMLQEQNRVTDRQWTEILSRLRVGECTDADIAEIDKLVLSNPNAPKTDLASHPWRNAVLVTSRNAVREKWNEASLMRHCKETGHRRYRISAEDRLTKSGGPLSPEARLKLAGMDAKRTGKLVDRLDIAIGMKAMVMLNVATEADVANGTRGIITDIILDPREDAQETTEGLVHLKYPPSLIVFKPDQGCSVDFGEMGAVHVPPGHVPIVPMASKFTVTATSRETVEVTRRQMALSAAYAFTDYKAQGQTIEYVIIDLADPPSKHLSPFSAYVALSRSRGRDTIRILRPFNPDMFTCHPSADLKAEMERLEALNETTKVKCRQGVL